MVLEGAFPGTSSLIQRTRRLLTAFLLYLQYTMNNGNCQHLSETFFTFFYYYIKKLQIKKGSTYYYTGTYEYCQYFYSKKFFKLISINLLTYLLLSFNIEVYQFRRELFKCLFYGYYVRLDVSMIKRKRKTQIIYFKKIY